MTRPTKRPRATPSATLAFSYREVSALDLAYGLANLPEDAARIRPLLHTWHRVEPDDLDALAAAIGRVRDACARPIRAVTARFWHPREGRPLSGWEHHVLRVADFAESPSQTPAALAALLDDVLEPLERLMIVAVCGHPALARRLATDHLEAARRATAETRWIEWLAGRETSAAKLAAPWSHPREGDPLTPNLAAALRGDWAAVLRESSAKALSVEGKPATDREKVLVQLARLRLQTGAAPDEAVVHRSFGRWFGWSHRHSAYALARKAPYAYLYARELKPAAPEDAVAEIGRHVAHVKRPPARTFMVDAQARAHLDALAAFIDDALTRGVALRATRDLDGVDLVAGD